MTVDLRHGDNLTVLPTLPDNSVDAIVTDPPYGLGLMGRTWDATVPVHIWAECLRVLKPGGHLLAFGGTRTWHRQAVAIEDAGFEIRDSIAWLYGSGFPKSRRVSADIDRVLGSPRGRVDMGHDGALNSGTANGWRGNDPHSTTAPLAGTRAADEPTTVQGRQWQGWGTALKPASEPIVVARKPLSGTVAATVLAHGTGALNVAACRVPHADRADFAKHAAMVEKLREQGGSLGDSWKNSSDLSGANPVNTAGRWPANVVLTHGEQCTDVCVDGCPVAELDAQSGAMRARGNTAPTIRAGIGYHDNDRQRSGSVGAVDPGDQGGASRFFPTFRYQAKAPTSERPKIDGQGWPTVKPLALMRWLVRLVTPPGGLVLDPFAGTGPTLQACELEGFNSLGVELDPFAYQLACQRLDLDVRDVVGHQDSVA